jgi:ABC transport system ATP-binding/permease protein
MAKSPSRSRSTAVAPPLLAIQNGKLSVAERVLFEDADLALAAGDRACLVGRNGAGKSTLMRALAGEIELDSGEVFRQPGTRVAYLHQDPPLPEGITIRSHVAAALPPTDDGVPREHIVDTALVHLSLDGERLTDGLSGGEARRVAIARAVVGQPDVLLLDEPTNHLDLPTIEWLEEELKRFQGALLLVSHDRAFLSALTNRTFWVDRGELRRLGQGFAGFVDWADKVLEDEEAAERRHDKRIAVETKWLREGLTARRKRNMGRVASLLTMRRDKAQRLKRTGDVAMSLGDAERSGQLVLEANHISKSFTGPDGEETVIARDFSTMIRRGDRVGLLGPNGAGKTTLLRMLIGLEKPDRGRVRIGFGVEPVYFDQRREQLDPERSLWATLCPNGGDQVEVHGRPRHVVGYLRDFLFDERQATARVKTLSGGERNRLLLAKLFAQPHNLVVLDEPTNDLDIETLDLLQEVLGEYDGTIVLVSHDRDFLERVVTSTIAVEGAGEIEEYPGGYSDYVTQRRPRASDTDASAPTERKPPKTENRAPKRQAKLGYKDQRELDGLPDRIAGLEAEIAEIERILADTGLYNRDPTGFATATARHDAAANELSAAEERWLELEALREELEASRQEVG